MRGKFQWFHFKHIFDCTCDYYKILCNVTYKNLSRYAALNLLTNYYLVKMITDGKRNCIAQ